MTIIEFFSPKHKYKAEPLVFDSNFLENIKERRKEYLIKRNFWNILDDVVYSVKSNFREVIVVFYSIKEGLYNFVKYRKVIYKDRWWDYAFFTDLLEAKLIDMRDNWKYSNAENSHEEQETLNRLCELIAKIKENDEEPLDEFFDLLKANYRKFWD